MPRTRMAHPEFEMASHGDGAAAAVAALGISDPEAGTTGRRCGGISRCSPPTSPYPTKFYGNTVELAKLLLSEGQSHLFEHWPEPGVDDDKKRNFFDQACRLKIHIDPVAHPLFGRPTSTGRALHVHAH
uniref:Uncharacterized protein n=1 Tax=Oryza meridionalis TaxID=40149 RepID=A0A0E0CKG4_9ORYZ